ncbi:DUF2971 domain-containing protein [Aquipseudomonas ullengensis]|uniref:DUF2971 domain-containing protein n=1 Tax=Aquipseudomonas ullengensis TaxID=2759166 RepID=A0A7W4QD31_9GAMM|nr:DUF2971 domain-containing protein [Pseudomonas ullengensis]MBB2494133.1 DUF2971 domain-containing protein [Pseudomonas ullengensis]
MIESTNQVSHSGKLSVRLAHPSFPQPERDVKVWRYMSLAKLISLLETKSLYLTRVDKFSDPYEGTLTARTAAGIEAHLKQLGSSNGFEELREIFKKSRMETFASCWHANDHESEAMWRLYCGSASGVAVQTTYSKLVNSIEHQYDVHIGLVRYIDYTEGMFPDANTFSPCMHKRASFSHEHEVRLVHFSMSPPEPEVSPESSKIPWDLQVYADRIYVDPYAPTYYFEAVKAVLAAMCPSLSPRLEWSQMKSLPFY